MTVVGAALVGVVVCIAAEATVELLVQEEFRGLLRGRVFFSLVLFAVDFDVSKLLFVCPFLFGRVCFTILSFSSARITKETD